MARYRVGNSYLSQHEYDQHVFEHAAGVIMIIGASIGGLLAYYFSSPEWPKLMRLGLIVGASIYFGYKSVQYHATILAVVQLSLMGIATYQLVPFIWSFL
ncbi:hypothetical protein [Aurantivibrio plasticivorans]